ncbi:thioredoxin TrxC [Methylotetracoccus oryzae]|uniref:thioredoxin TrxC n=1 Tax=Methylotetracoccus oryzae TaxID=1919059 RepID=UPI00111927E3|nr:thioredoxin TrxC [Methylotetracoccus oryzae]
MTGSLRLVCPHCSSVNRLPADRLNDGGRCGRCKRPLFVGEPVELNTANFHTHLTGGDLPLVIDFWAPWCAPCRVMAPAFAQAARSLEPHYRLARLDTEAYPRLAEPFHIRSIPTLLLLQGGREVRRQSGVVDVGSIIRWVTG